MIDHPSITYYPSLSLPGLCEVTMSEPGRMMNHKTVDATLGDETRIPEFIMLIAVVSSGGSTSCHLIPHPIITSFIITLSP